MKVFKYLVALADISVGFLGLFFIIFAVTRPVSRQMLQRNRTLEKQVADLQQRLRNVQDIALSRAKTGTALETGKAAEIVLRIRAVTLRRQGAQRTFATLAAFLAAVPQQNWPARAILYIDRRVPFDRVVRIIDALKQVNRDLTVQIAALKT